MIVSLSVKIDIFEMIAFVYDKRNEFLESSI